MQQAKPDRSFWAWVFISPDEPRLRAGWRLALQSVACLTLLICLSIPAAVLLFSGQAGGDVLTLLSSVAELFAFTATVFLARRFLDRRPIASLGLQLDRWTVLDLLAGVAITFLLMGGIYLTMSLLGWVRFEGFAWQTETPAAVLRAGLVMLLAYVLVGWNEELLSRGYHLQTLASGTNVYWGVLLSSLIFSMLHIVNPSADWVSTLGIFLAGLFLASGYLCTRRLWLSIGLHIGWNLFEGPVFGFPVSGTDSFHFLRIRLSGPSLWTGGPFGPEAGLVVVPALVLGALLVLAYAWARRKWGGAGN